ncbi:MAG: hypothetical protein U5J62_10895 [Desulfurivibrio sp.]|nr:hypothetical protein [Desulfurivibrio sp.]
MVRRLFALFLCLSLGWLLVACAPPAVPPPGAPPEPPVALPEVEEMPEAAPAQPPAAAVPEQPSPSLELSDEMLAFAGAREKPVAERLAFHRQQMRRWRELDERSRSMLIEPPPAAWDECRRELKQLRDHYEQARDALRDLQFGELERWPAAVAALSDAQQADLDFQGGACPDLYQQLRGTVEAGLERFQTVAAEQLEAVVRHHAAAGRSEETLAALSNLERQYPRRLRNPDLLQQVARDLARAGAQAEALALLSDFTLSTESSVVTAPARLRADLLLLAGRREAARQQYETLAAHHAARARERQWVAEQLRLLQGEILVGQVERDLFLEIMRDYVLYAGKGMPPRLRERLERLESLYPGGMLTSRARKMVQEVAERAERWLERRQQEIEELLAGGDYRQAIGQLEELQAEQLAAEQQNWVAEQLGRAREARRREQEQRRQLRQQALAMQWEEANRLLGLQRYEQAIAAFSRLLTTEYGDKARRRIQEASREAATEIRRQAATLFVRARRAGGEEGLKLAGESWRMLQRIIADYPDSEIIPRVRDNLRSVEEYLEGLEAGAVERLRDNGKRSEKVGE